MCIAALNRALRERICALLELVDDDAAVDLGNISDETYVKQKLVMRQIEERLLQQPTAYWMERFDAAGVPCGRVNYRPDLYADPQVEALSMMWRLENTELGTYLAPGFPIRFSETPARPGRGSPTLGEHSEALLREAGYDEHEIVGLVQAGVLRARSAG